MCKRTPNRSFEVALDGLVTLQDLQKRVILQRYIPLLDTYEFRCAQFAIIFHVCRVIITVGSLIVPALLSIQYTASNPASTDDFSFRIYWTTWFLSLFVTTSNGIVTLFKIDKKYYLLHTTLEQLRSEGWQYLGLSGKYSGFHTPNLVPTHQNQFLFFVHAVEKIKMKQVEEEYFKINDGSHPTPTAAPNQQQQSNPPFVTDGLIPPTPLNPIQSTATVDGRREDQNSEVSVRSEVQTGTDAAVSVLPATQGQMSPRVTADRIGTELRA
jgi:Protein of unknown function (DUF4231)